MLLGHSLVTPFPFPFPFPFRFSSFFLVYMLLTFLFVGRRGSWRIGGSVRGTRQGLEGGIILGDHHALIEQLCTTRSNIPTFFLSLFLSMQLLCHQVFGCEWHAEMKAADTTNAIGLDSSFMQQKRPPLLHYFLYTSSKFENTDWTDWN